MSHLARLPFFHSVVGSLQQLIHLTDYANDIFQELAEFSTELNTRLTNVSRRASNLTNKLSDFNGRVVSLQTLGNTTDMPLERTDVKTRLTGFITKDTIPKGMTARYNAPEQRQVPGFNILDQFLTQEELQAMGGTCNAKFSNPKFFLIEWTKKQDRMLDELQQERDQRKNERKMRKKQQQQLAGTTATASSGIARVNKKSSLNWRDR